MIDIADLLPDLEAFARRVESNASIAAADVLSEAQALLARVAGRAPSASEQLDAGPWQAFSISGDSSGERRVACWCERPGGDALIEGNSESLTVAVGGRAWMKQGTLLLQSDIAADATVAPEDATFFAGLKERGERLLKEHVRAPRSEPVAEKPADWRCATCGQDNPNHAKFCMNCAAPAPKASGTS